MNDVTDPRLGIGGNAPPEPLVEKTYAEQMLDGSAAARARATTLIDALNNSGIDSFVGVEKVTALGNLIAAHRSEMDAERVRLKRPHDLAAAAVQDAWQPYINLLKEAEGAAKRMIDAWRQKQAEALRQEEQRRAAEALEARRREEAAAAAKARAEAEGDGAAALDAELAALRARDEAEALAAPAVRPDTMVRTQAGSAGARPDRVPSIDDLRKCLSALYKAHRPALIEVITPLVTRLIRARVTLDGVSVVEQQKTTFRR